jgi:hypothetical protein
MPLGRETECARIDALLEGARQGKGGTLVLRGEAGVGKSTLLEYARQEADGMTVLSARSVETEAELALAGLSQALWPILDLSEALPAPQRAALEAGLGRGPPLAPGDRFAVYAAVLSLLVAASEHSPVLLLADDAHWLDRSSAEALTFSARRLGEEGVALIFARREPHPGAFDPDDLPEMHLDGLEPAAAVQLLRQHVSAEISATMAEHLVDATGGNPLALIELPDVLTEAQLAGREALAEPLPVGPQIEGGFQRRIAGLSPRSQRALAVAAASGSNTTDELVPALRELGMSLGDLEPAEMSGLVAVNGSALTFPHPLARSAAYQASSSQERRAAHRALAEALA